VRPTIRLGRVAGIPIGLHWSALIGLVVLAALLALTVLPVAAPGSPPVVDVLCGIATAVAFALSLLAHEIAHSVVARRAGLRVGGITLWLLGGASELRDEPARPGVEARVAFTGPLASGLLGGLFGMVAGLTAAPPAVSVALAWLAAMNLLLAAFNLLPGSPLDGGRLVHALVWAASGDPQRATRVAAGSGRVLGAVLAGVGAVLALSGRLDGLWLVLVGWFVAGTAAGERGREAVAEALTGLTAADVMTSPADIVPEWWTVAGFVDRMHSPDAPRHRTFPVAGFDGEITGIIGLAEVAAVRPADRAGTTLARIARPLPPELVVDATTPLTRIARLPLRSGRDLVVVRQVDRPPGVLSATDLRRAVEIQALDAGHPHGGTHPPHAPAARSGGPGPA
jgi:Zn-dependent protease